MKRLIPLFILVLAAVGGCGGSDASDAETTTSSTPVESTAPEITGTVMTSTNGATQITVPDDWDAMTDLNDVAIIQAANLAKEQYIIVIDDTKEDFADPNLAQYSDITAQLIVDGLNAPEVDAPTELTINGYPALQKEIRGSIDNINVVYLHTSVETPSHFYQVLTWTLKSRFDQNRSVLQEVTNSLTEAG